MATGQGVILVTGATGHGMGGERAVVRQERPPV